MLSVMFPIADLKNPVRLENEDKTKCTRWDKHTSKTRIQRVIVLAFVINEVSDDFDSENVLASGSADTFFISVSFVGNTMVVSGAGATSLADDKA